MRFRTLLVGHDVADPPEASLVLAATAALNGLQANGEPMPRAGAAPRAPTMREIADELGLALSAVRRGVRHLEAAGAVHCAGGVQVDPEQLRRRAAAHGQMLRLSDDLRQLGLRAAPLLIAALVAGQADQRGRLVLGIDRLAARTGLPRRTVQRALAAAEAAGALHRWTIPGRWQLCIAPGRSRVKAAQEKGAAVAREIPPPPPPRRETAQEMVSAARAETAHPPFRNGAPPLPKWRSQRAETAHAYPDSGVPRTHPEARVPARGADRSAVPEPEPATSRPERDPEIQLQASILRTGLRSKLRPFDRLRFSMQLAKPLGAAGCQPADIDALWALAQQRSTSDDPASLLAHWLAGDWRGVLDEGRAKDRHAAARARQSGAGVIQPASEIVPLVLAQAFAQ